MELSLQIIQMIIPALLKLIFKELYIITQLCMTGTITAAGMLRGNQFVKAALFLRPASVNGCSDVIF